MGTRAGHEDELFYYYANADNLGNRYFMRASRNESCFNYRLLVPHCLKQGLELIVGFCGLLCGEQSGVWLCRVAWAVQALPQEERSIGVCAALPVPLPKPIMLCWASFPGAQPAKGSSAAITEAVEIVFPAGSCTVLQIDVWPGCKSD